MSLAVNRGCRIAFDVVGEGPTVVLQGGLTSRRCDVARLGYVAAFADRCRVVNIDSLGHGDSDKPLDHALYGASQRAGDIAAVLDQLGIERAHVLGYSMGGWMACAMIIHQAHRLASVIIGGWNPGSPERSSAQGERGFDELMAFARREIPEQMSWITAGVEPAVRCCWAALDEIQDIEESLPSFGRPVLLWNGVDDESRSPAARLAARYENVQLLETSGDHMSAWFTEDDAARRALRAFVDTVEDGA
jgi:pimeloyl-ACP methyl ester carboxylesterase